jgi:hypothetical protein
MRIIRKPVIPRWPIVSALLIPLVGCSASSEPAEDWADTNYIAAAGNALTEINSMTPPEDAAPPATKSHNYNLREGDLYGYIAAVSEEERKQGRAAGEVVLYRYRGVVDGLHRLENVDAAGRTVGINECPSACVAIKSYQYGRPSRIAFNPSSIIGAAFEDAIAGRLNVVREAAVATSTMREEAASPLDNSAGAAPTEPPTFGTPEANEAERGD